MRNGHPNTTRPVSQEVQSRREEISGMYVRGCKQHEIAEKFGISVPRVCQILKDIRAAWLKSAVRDFDTAKSCELAKLDEIEREAWSAWERSSEDAEMTVTKTERIKAWEKDEGETGKGKNGRKVTKAKGRTAATTEDAEMIVVKEVTERSRKGQTGDPRFLEMVVKCIEARSKILGLFKEVTQVNNNIAVIDWGSMVQRPPQADPVRARIEDRTKDVPGSEALSVPRASEDTVEQTPPIL